MKIQFPQIPEDLEALSAEELRTLAAAIRAAFSEAQANASTVSLADAETALAQNALRPAIVKLANTKQALAEGDGGTEDEEKPTVTEASDTGDGETDDGDGDGTDDGDGEEGDGETEASAKPGRKLPTSVGQATSTNVAVKDRPVAKTKIMDYLTAGPAAPGRKAGSGFESWKDLAESIYDCGQNVKSDSELQHIVGVVKANYDKSRTIDALEYQFNLSMFEPEEMLAALCAPATPYYDMHCMNTTRRPIFNALPGFAAPRMKVSIYPSPLLTDIVTGVGQWTAANEASTNATKLPCQTIVCGSPTEYQAYGVYRCMTIRNMLAMSFPELVEAWLNRLAAAQARLGEQLLLNAMGTAVTSITAPALGYGATTSIITTLMQYLALFQEQQRWEDFGQNMNVYLHRWVKMAIKMDLARRRNVSGNPQRVVSDAEVNRLFNDAGFDPIWFIDTPTWAEPIPTVSTGGVLNLLPQYIDALVAPKTKFGLIDRGELRIGVTGNGIYRDNNSNNRNEFTFFMENFEGIVDTGECGGVKIKLPVCVTGIQVDDQLVNCQGGDMITHNFQS